MSDTLVVLSVLLILFVPGVIILIAMSFTTRYIISADAELVRLTALLEHSMVSGYTFAVLYRARYLLALSLAMTPALMLIVSSAYRSKYFIWHAVEFLRNDVWLAYWSERPHYGTLIVSSSQENLLAWLIWVGGMWGLNWLAASSGVALAIKRQFFLGNIIAPLFLLTVALCLMWVFISAELTASESVLFRNALLPALSYPLAFAVIRLASRWMRRT
ncbi:MAG: hypothetical protein HYZ49_06615 [Chloroflexi bacterium]|nr:hypothetical protein [Chloroflexota bacterium]